jgi:triacylglycerol lipase
MILSGNHCARPEFFPPFEGRTWEYLPKEGWKQTYDGDGIVPHRDSWLPGADHLVLPAREGVAVAPPDRYCHIHLPRNAEVIARVMDYLMEPDNGR